MKFLLLLLLLNIGCGTYVLATPAQALPLERGVNLKPTKSKFRWKRIFRPIRIFTKKIPFWMLWATLLALFGRWMLEYEESYSSNFLDYTLVGMVLLGSAIVAICILLYPIIFVVRIIEEIKWQRRYRKCKY